MEKVDSGIHYPILAIHGAWGRGVELHRWLYGNGVDSFTVHAPNLYNHGFSGEEKPRCLNGVSISRYVDDMHQELLRLGPCHIVGHSLGGLIAQLLADRYPLLVRSVSLLASTPPSGIRVPFQWAFVKPWYVWAFITGRGFNLREVEKKRFFHDLSLRHAYFGSESGRVCRESLLGLFQVKPITVPTLVCAGREDPFFSVSVAEKLARFHNAQLLLFVTGHMIYCSSEGKRLRSLVIRHMCDTDKR